MCPRWASSCSLKQVYITCRKTCNKCTVPLVADFKPTVSQTPVTNYRRPVPPQQPQPKPANNFFGGLFNSFRLPTLGKPVTSYGRPQVVSEPVVPAPVQKVEEPVQAVQNARTVARDQMPYEVAVLLGLADPFAVKGPGSRAEGVPVREPLVLGPQAPAQPESPVQPVVEQPVYEPVAQQPVYQPVVQQPVYQPEAQQPVYQPAPVQVDPAPVVVTTTKATTTTTEAVTTEAPTEAPEASGEGSGESIEVTFEDTAALPVETEVAALPTSVEAIPDAVINEVIEPEMAARLMDAMCVDELVNCADASVIDFCSAMPGDENYEKFLPFQQGCRRTCGICDKNASCPDLKDHCYDEGVRSICAATCRGF